MSIETLSTFPHMYDSVMGTSMMRIAQEKGILDFHAYDLRDWTHDRHRTTDDDPYGGGAGLVMKCEPLFEAYDDICARAVGAAAPASAATPADAAPTADAAAGGLGLASAESVAARQPKPHVIFLAPQGRRFDDACALELAKEERLLFVCGHYEGIDERAYALADYQISLGDYVLTSGELASMVVIDAVVRKLPGVLGADGGAEEESFAQGLLEFPQYTRPANFRGVEVPPVLLSGDHGKVDEWRRQQSLKRTLECRPDLLDAATLTGADREFLRTLRNE